MTFDEVEAKLAHHTRQREVEADERMAVSLIDYIEMNTARTAKSAGTSMIYAVF